MEVYSVDLPQSRQGDQTNDHQQIQVSSQYQSLQYKNTSQLIVSIPKQQLPDTSKCHQTQHSIRLSSSPHQLIVSIPRSLVASIEPPRTNAHSDRGVHIPPAKKIRIDSCHQIAASSSLYHMTDNSDSSPQNLLQSNCNAEENKDEVTHKCSRNQQKPDSDNFVQIYAELIKERADWYNIGLALGVESGELDAIELTNRNECKICLRKMLQHRINTKYLAWTDVIAALKSPLVEKNTLADIIQKKCAPETTSSSHSPEPGTSSTPECLLSYASFLKHWYTEMPIFPDNWPPPLKEKITKLALVQKKEENPLPQCEHTQSIEHAYATGNVDNIVTRKQEIIFESIFKNLPNKNSELKRFSVLMDGAPGVGKTTLTRKICIDWAEGKLLTDHQIVVLKPLREMRDHTTASLSDILEADDPELKEQVIKYVQKTSGLGVMFIFDGFDELSSKERSNKDSLLWKIIQGKYLVKCSVLVTSRSYASGPLLEVNHINRHVEVLGFKIEDIENCIQQNITDKERAGRLVRSLKERLDIVSLCYIPLNCRIVLYVYQQLNGTLPKTLTELYKVFILYTIKHYKDKVIQQHKDKIDEDQIEDANSLDDLPFPIKNDLLFLSKIAFTGMLDDKIIFEHKDIKTKRNNLLEFGLLNIINYIGRLGNYYQFLHLTIQEFLAARYLTLHSREKESNEELQEFFSKNLSVDRFRMTLIFLSGSTQLKFLPVDQPFLLPDKTPLKLNLTNGNEDTKSKLLLLAHILYESQRTDHNWLLPCLATKSLDLSEHKLSQFDCLVLANFLAMTPEDHVWDEINLYQCGLTNDCIQMLLTKNHTKQGISVLLLTKELNVLFNNICIDMLTPVLTNESKVEYLNISLYNFPKFKNVDKTLKKIVLTDAEDESIIITNTKINIAGKNYFRPLQYLLEYVPIKCLKHLSIHLLRDYEECRYCWDSRKNDCQECASFGNDMSWKCAINLDLKHCRYIHIKKPFFSEDEILFLYEKLTKCENLYLFEMESENTVLLNMKKLIHLQQSTQSCVNVQVNFRDVLKFSISIQKDKFVHIDIENLQPLRFFDNDKYNKERNTALKELNSILSPLLEEDLSPEVHGVTVTTKSFFPPVFINSLKKSNIVKHLTLSNLSIFDYMENYYYDDGFYTYCSSFKNVLKNIQTMPFKDCMLSDRFIELLEEGLSSNTTFSVKNISQDCMYQTSDTILKCQQLQALEIHISKDQNETFFSALSHNRTLRKLIIRTYAIPLLFQTILSTSITYLKVDGEYRPKDDRVRGSLAFKQLVNENQLLTILKVNNCELTDEAFEGLTLKKESPLVKLSIINNSKSVTKKGLTYLFNSLCSSRITTLDISQSTDYTDFDSDCYEAFNKLLENKSLSVLKIGFKYNTEKCDNVVSCIAKALSQNCYLEKLKIVNYSSQSFLWTKLYQSIHQNTLLKKLICNQYSPIKCEEDKENVIKSLCEMLQHNKGLKSLIISDNMIIGPLREFAMAYIQRQPVLNLTVGRFDIELLEEIDKIQPNNDYSRYISYLSL